LLRRALSDDPGGADETRVIAIWKHASTSWETTGYRNDVVRIRRLIATCLRR
jgi:hypothetical protein